MGSGVLLSVASALLYTGLAAADAVRAIDSDFADPCLIQTSDGYYAFATSGNNVNVQVASSSDFSSWDLMSGTDALPGPFPSWVASSPSVWAPDVIQRPGYEQALCWGRNVLERHRSLHPSRQRHRLPSRSGGAIDPDGFKDGDTFYVVYKIDGNSLDGDGTTHATPIMLQALNSDAVTPNGDPTQILDRDDADGPLIEAPSLVNVDGTYYLSFSSNIYSTLKYDVSYATASAVGGPYTKVQAPDAPLLVSGDPSNVGDLGGPGGADFSTDGSKIVFHAFENGQNLDNGRAMYTASISASGGVISIQ
ncbi:hypothetical protein N7468_001321 [Penicillium chermesinum]|uniref:Arabinanase/levansucrase/invertase n=1 Tax=Penicillium chermesinum TaxID=63820 RepID=A0A9W9TX87_9EURO|nr:uncharacterized protein N7468_001321 [Penicillium chermesinum]KAJ5246338.1 hypothetical protein N7468_001321 [Penicillium chermesinum]